MMSLGPANDTDVTPLRRPPRDDNGGGFGWDAARPLAEQWPWNGKVRYTTEDGAVHYTAAGERIGRVRHMLEAIEHFAPSDTASTEPWHAYRAARDKAQR